MSNTIRITGMASGLDVDSIVKQLMKGENTRLDTMKQKRQLVQWQQDAYRDILSDLSTFKSTYFNVTSDKNMFSLKAYSAYDVSYVPSTGAAASANAFGSVTTGTYTISDIILATKASIRGEEVQVGAGTSKTKAVSSSKIADITGLGGSEITSMNGKVDFSITYGVKADKSPNKIDFHYDFSDSGSDKDKCISDIMNDISTKTGLKASLSELGGTVSLSTNETGSDQKIILGWNDTNSTTKTFMGLFGVPNNDQTPDPNAKTTTVGKTGTNGSSATCTIAGSDAYAKITDPNGVTNSDYATKAISSKNTFSLDGIQYNLLQNTTGSQDVKITVTSNGKAAVDKIKDFISKYNDIVDKIRTKVTEKKNKDYQPLTDDQKKAMSADDIKAWEAKAKVGILKGDNELEGLAFGMRNALFSAAQNVGINLTTLGLDTSNDIDTAGEIKIKDEAKLTEYVQNNPSKVADLFMKQSTSVPDYSKSLTQEQRGIRTKEEGVLQAVYDTLEDYTSTLGGKGLLLQKAGIKGDFTEYTNTLTDDLNKKDKDIADMVKKLADKEDAYYQKFSKLESAMSQLNSQQNWLTQQLSH